MPYHLHFADQVFSATADIQYHLVVDDSVSLAPHLIIDDAYHEQIVEGPWAADATPGGHLHFADNIALEVILYAGHPVHHHWSENIELVLGLVGLDTYHLTEGDVIWATPIVVEDTFHITSDDDTATGSSVKILADNPPTGLAGFDLPTLTAVGYGGGYVDVDMPMLESTATGFRSDVGEADIDLPLFTVRAYGGGTAYGTFPVLSATGTGQQSAVGTAGLYEATLPMLTATGTGYNSSNSVATLTLPQISVAATGLVSIIATANITLPNLEIDATGIDGEVGTASASLGRMSVTGTGYIVPNGDVDDDLPMIEIEATGTSSDTRFCSYVLEYTR